MTKPHGSVKQNRRRPVSGPALVVLTLVLAGLWYGSRSLSQTSTVSVDTTVKPTTPVATSVATPQSSPAATPPATPAPPPVPAPADQPALPAGYPAGIPVPHNATLIKAIASGKASDQSFVASYQLSGIPADVSASYQKQLTDAGFTVQSVLGSADAGFFGASKDALSLTVSVGADQVMSGKTNLTLTTSSN